MHATPPEELLDPDDELEPEELEPDDELAPEEPLDPEELEPDDELFPEEPLDPDELEPDDELFPEEPLDPDEPPELPPSPEPIEPSTVVARPVQANATRRKTNHRR